MIEVDHTEVPPPEPARPILASNLLAIEKRQRKRFSGRGERIRTGCGEIDDCMLGGGFERGIVVGISAEAEEGRLVSCCFCPFSVVTYYRFYGTCNKPSYIIYEDQISFL